MFPASMTHHMDSQQECISRELSPGHINGNGALHHYTTDAVWHARGLSKSE